MCALYTSRLTGVRSVVISGQIHCSHCSHCGHFLVRPRVGYVLALEGWTPMGFGFQIKSPQFFAASQPAVEGWRGIGGKASIGMRGAARKILRGGHEVTKHGTGDSLYSFKRELKTHLFTLCFID